MITKEQRDYIVANDNALRAWMFKRKRNSYKPSELPDGITPPTNDQRSQVELFDWINDPPKSYFAYPSECGNYIVNWMGERLAKIVWRGRLWKDNMGSSRVCFRCNGTNRVRYYGTIYETYCRMKAVKP